MSLTERFRERKIVQWSIAYLAGAWLVLQVLDVAADPFHLPGWVGRAAFVLLAIGLPATAVLAWYHGEKGRQRVSAPELLIIALLLALAGGGIAIVGGDRTVADRDAVATPPAGGAEGASPAVEIPPGSIAVLPFVNMSPSAEDEYFSDGLTEELISALARVPGIRVTARTSAFAFKGNDRDIRTIGRTLGVATVLEGSVRRDRDSVRVTAQLIDAEDGFHLWAQSYNRELAGVFALQEDLAKAIVGALEVTLDPGATDRLVPEGTDSREAYDLYLQGQYHWAHWTASGFEQAVTALRQSIEADPRYAPAHASLATVYEFLAYFGVMDPADALPVARVEMDQALALDPANAEALTGRGMIRFLWDRDWAGAESDLTRAIELSPGFSQAYWGHSLFLGAMGRFDEALQSITRARALDPLSLPIMSAAGITEVADGRLEEARETVRRMLALEPNFANANWLLGAIEIEAGNPASAVAALERAVALDPSPLDQAWLGWAYARAGREPEARQVLATLRERREKGSGYVAPFLLAVLHEGLGEKEEALDWLEVAYEENDSFLVYVKHAYPRFDTLRDDPRFEALIGRLDLPD